MSKGSWGVIVLIAALPACTTRLNAPPLDLKSNVPVAGWDYSLPFAQYETTIVRTVKACKVDELELDVSAAATVQYDRDPMATYTIDYRSLSAGTKISDLQIEKYPNGMLKRVGAASEDRTGPIIVNTATTIVKLAQTAKMIAAGAKPDKRRRVVTVCTEKVENILRELPALRQVVTVAKGKLEEATADLMAITAVVTPLKGRTDAAIQRMLVQQAKEVVKRQAALGVAARSYGEALEAISDTQKLRWPTNGQERTVVNEIDLRKLNSWLEIASTKKYPITIALEGASPFEAPSPVPSAVDDCGTNPLRYRVPIKGRLVFYDGVEPKGVKKLIVEGSVPQMGRTYLLPFKNRPFQNNALSASFAEDGTLIAAGYTEKVSVAEAVSETAMKVASALPQAVKDIRLGGVQMQADMLAAETAVLENQGKLDKARAALNPSATDEQVALLKADTALQEAELANIAAAYALEEARRDPASTKKK